MAPSAPCPPLFRLQCHGDPHFKASADRCEPQLEGRPKSGPRASCTRLGFRKFSFYGVLSPFRIRFGSEVVPPSFLPFSQEHRAYPVLPGGRAEGKHPHAGVPSSAHGAADTCGLALYLFFERSAPPTGIAGCLSGKGSLNANIQGPSSPEGAQPHSRKNRDTY